MRESHSRPVLLEPGLLRRSKNLGIAMAVRGDKRGVRHTGRQPRRRWRAGVLRFLKETPKHKNEGDAESNESSTSSSSSSSSSARRDPTSSNATSSNAKSSNPTFVRCWSFQYKIPYYVNEVTLESFWEKPAELS